MLGGNGERLDRHAARRIVRRLASKAGINKPVGPHTLRPAFITAALDAGVPLRDVQEAASHADPPTTMRRPRCATTGHACRSTGTPLTWSPPSSPAPLADEPQREALGSLSRLRAGGAKPRARCPASCVRGCAFVERSATLRASNRTKNDSGGDLTRPKRDHPRRYWTVRRNERSRCHRSRAGIMRRASPTRPTLCGDLPVHTSALRPFDAPSRTQRRSSLMAASLASMSLPRMRPSRSSSALARGLTK